MKHETGSKTIATSQLRRFMPATIAAALVLVLSSGFMIGAASATCPASAPSVASQVALPKVSREQPPPIERTTAAAIPIWKTITVGTYKDVDAVRSAVDAAPCPIAWPVARYSGELVDFTVGNGGTDLMLIGGDARPEMILPGAVRLVLERPRRIADFGS